MSDPSPFESHPEDNEYGHAEGCARLAADVAAWQASRTVGGGQVMALTITDKTIRSADAQHIAELAHFQAGDAWKVSWLPGWLMDWNAAVSAMMIAQAVGRGLGLSDDPTWPHIDGWAEELCLSGPAAVVLASEPDASRLPAS